MSASSRALVARANLLDGLGHWLRLLIVETLIDVGEPASPSKIAAELDEGLAGVAYHVKGLLAGGAIEAAGEEKVYGAIEHYYRPTPAAIAVVEAARRFQ